MKKIEAEKLMEEYGGRPIVWILKDSFPGGSGFEDKETGVIISATHVTDPVPMYKEDGNGTLKPQPGLLKPRIFESTHLKGITATANLDELQTPKMILTIAMADFSISALGENREECLEKLVSYLERISPTLMTNFEFSEYLNDQRTPKKQTFLLRA